MEVSITNIPYLQSHPNTIDIPPKPMVCNAPALAGSTDQTPPSKPYQQKNPQYVCLKAHLNKNPPTPRNSRHRSPLSHKSHFPHCLAILPQKPAKNIATVGGGQFNSAVCAASNNQLLGFVNVEACHAVVVRLRRVYQSMRCGQGPRTNKTG